jgi:hypothetical protein
MLAALDLYDSFGIPIPSNDSLAALLHPAEDPLVLSVYLAPKGLVNIAQSSVSHTGRTSDLPQIFS